MAAWVSADDLRALLDLAADDPTDERLELLESIAQDQVETRIGGTIAVVPRDEEIDGYGTDTLEVSYRPVVGEVTLTRYQADEAVDSILYHVDTLSGVITHRTGTFAKGVAAYRAQYSAGHEVTQALVGVVAELVALLINRLPAAGLTSETLDQYSYQISAAANALSPLSQGVLADWRARFMADAA